MRLGVYLPEYEGKRPQNDYGGDEEVWRRVALYDFDAGEWSEGSDPSIIKKIPPWCDDPEQFQDRLADHHYRVVQPKTVADAPDVHEIVEVSGTPVEETLRERATEGYTPTTDDERRWQPVYSLLDSDGYDRLLEMGERARQQFLDRVASMSHSDRKAAVKALVEGRWPEAIDELGLGGDSAFGPTPTPSRDSDTADPEAEETAEGEPAGAEQGQGSPGKDLFGDADIEFEMVDDEGGESSRSEDESERVPADDSETEPEGDSPAPQ